MRLNDPKPPVAKDPPFAPSVALQKLAPLPSMTVPGLLLVQLEQLPLLHNHGQKNLVTTIKAGGVLGPLKPWTDPAPGHVHWSPRSACQPLSASSVTSPVIRPTRGNVPESLSVKSDA